MDVSGATSTLTDAAAAAGFVCGGVVGCLGVILAYRVMQRVFGI